MRVVFVCHICDKANILPKKTSCFSFVPDVEICVSTTAIIIDVVFTCVHKDTKFTYIINTMCVSVSHLEPNI